MRRPASFQTGTSLPYTFSRAEVFHAGKFQTAKKPRIHDTSVLYHEVFHANVVLSVALHVPMVFARMIKATMALAPSTPNFEVFAPPE